MTKKGRLLRAWTRFYYRNTQHMGDSYIDDTKERLLHRLTEKQMANKTITQHKVKFTPRAISKVLKKADRKHDISTILAFQSATGIYDF